MESEETTGESSYPAPVAPEITDIQKRLQQLCGGESQDSQVRYFMSSPSLKNWCVMFLLLEKKIISLNQ